MKIKLDRVITDETAGATVEWLLVAGVVVIMTTAANIGITTIIEHIYTRTALIIISPLG